MEGVLLADVSTHPPRLLTRHLETIESKLANSALSTSSLLGRMAAYHMGWVDDGGARCVVTKGKRLRPALCVWACEASGGAIEQALPAAVALEWIHNFTLIHDDIQDRGEWRRHRPTVWSTWGAAQAINAGDGLYALALRALLEPGRYPGRRLRAGQVITRAVLEVIQGQCLDLALEGRPHTSPTRYMRLIRAKTGALVGASLEAGAVMAGAGGRTGSAFRAAGRLLGLAFQLRDDWLGVWGDPAQTGKPRDGDLVRRKLSHPVIAAYALATPTQRRELRRLYGSAADGAEVRIRTLLEDLGGPDLTASAPADLARAAVAALRRGGVGEGFVEEFSEVAGYVAGRTG